MVKMKPQQNLEELRQIFGMLIAYLEQWYSNKFDLDNEQDYYVKIPYADRYKFLYHEGTTFEDLQYIKGLPYDDIKGLKRLLADKEAQPTALDFERLGAVLTVLGDTL